MAGTLDTLFKTVAKKVVSDLGSSLDTTIVWDSDTTEASSAASSAYPLDICASGFKIRTTSANYNASGGFYIYGAWGDVPGKYGNTFKSNYKRLRVY